ncbi:hypothetical protein Tco_1243523 [Tanacetum coccineum]
MGKKTLRGIKGRAFGKHLEEKHVTWARFEKKLDKNTTFQACDFHSDAFTKSAQKVKFLIKSETYQVVEMASEFHPDAVWIKARRREPELKARYEKALRKSEQMHQTFEKSALEMTHKFDDMIELPNSLLKKTNKDDLEYEMVMVKIPRKYKTTKQILPSFEDCTPPATYSKEVKETLGTPIEVEPLDHMKLEDVSLDTCNDDIPLSS